MKLKPLTARRLTRPTALALSALLGCGFVATAFANEPAHAPAASHAAAPAHAPEPAAAPAATAAHAEPAEPTKGQDTISRLKAVIEKHSGKGGSVSLRVGGHVIAASDSTGSTHAASNEHGAEEAHKPRKVKSSPSSREYIRARAAVLSGHAAPEAHAPAGGDSHEVHWEHQGENGPQNWAKLKPEFSTCATGQRQSPVHILETETIPGKAETLRFDYRPSGGSVVNNGHTVQVDLAGDNTLYVRGSAYKLIQFHFHHPAEERVNYKGFSMVAHLVHKNAEGQLAVVAVLIDPGAENALIDQVWTRMPLDVNDRVGLPAGLIDMNQILPADQRYYQFIGSLTTPPCTEGVLWLVMKQPMTVSREQLKLFTHLYPMNARPVQALNGRLVREAM
jgi:carbonic anhydrase